jgi:L-ascorbate metabolism protein UlaG (beta-lactamase superfamily)
MWKRLTCSTPQKGLCKLIMERTVSFAPQTKFSIRYSTERMVDQIRPFISQTAELLASGWSLTDSVHASAEAFPESSAYFDIGSGRAEETFGLKNEYLYQEWQIYGITVSGGERPSRVGIIATDEIEWRQLGQVLRLCADGNQCLDSLQNGVNNRWPQILKRLVDRQMLIETRQPHAMVLSDCPPGIYRLQHACLLYRTSKTGLLVDPHLHSIYSHLEQGDIGYSSIHDKVSAIAITHFHGDHWSLSSLMMFPRNTPIIVPAVPGSSVICGDMKSLLHSCGFTNVLTPQWNSVVEIGDMKIHVLPFYGEQPLRDEPARDSGLRNWGNTYLIETEDFTSWLLVDTGSDATGSMVEVARQVRRIVPKLDVVLSNLRRFAPIHPLYINCGLNWLTLTPSQLVRFTQMRDHCLTLGPERVAEICRITGASVYLPYAHWWGSLGQHGDSGIDTPGQEEAALVEELNWHLQNANTSTTIVPWCIGDGFVVKAGRGLERLLAANCFC